MSTESISAKGLLVVKFLYVSQSALPAVVEGLEVGAELCEEICC